MRDRAAKLAAQADCMSKLYRKRARAMTCRQCGVPLVARQDGTVASLCQTHLDQDAKRKKEARKK